VSFQLLIKEETNELAHAGESECGSPATQATASMKHAPASKLE
jgi:hypothetical protein